VTDSGGSTIPPTRPAAPAPEADNPVEDAITDDARASARGKLGWLSITVAAIFGLFYAFALWFAVAQALEVPSVFSEAGASAEFIPWWLVVVWVVLPVIVFLLAFWIGLRRNVFAKALIYVIGLAALSALTITLIGILNLILFAHSNYLD
jgi:hypothetical protein